MYICESLLRTAFLFAPFWLVSLLQRLFLSTASHLSTLSTHRPQVEGKSLEIALKDTRIDRQILLRTPFGASISRMHTGRSNGATQQLRYFRLFIGYIYMVDTFSAATQPANTWCTFRPLFPKFTYIFHLIVGLALALTFGSLFHRSAQVSASIFLC